MKIKRAKKIISFILDSKTNTYYAELEGVDLNLPKKGTFMAHSVNCRYVLEKVEVEVDCLNGDLLKYFYIKLIR